MSWRGREMVVSRRNIITVHSIQVWSSKRNLKNKEKMS